MGDSNSLDYLQRLEKALCHLTEQKKLFIKTDGQINTKFKRRMTSNDPWNFSSIISEVLIADHLLSLFGISNFQYEGGEKSERKPDFTVTVNDRLNESSTP